MPCENQHQWCARPRSDGPASGSIRSGTALVVLGRALPACPGLLENDGDACGAVQQSPQVEAGELILVSRADQRGKGRHGQPVTGLQLEESIEVARGRPIGESLRRERLV